MCDWYGSDNLEFQGPPLPVQSGYQDRCTLRGTHRGTRSFDALARRFINWKAKQVTSRRDFRAWKSHHNKDSTLRTHGDQNPKPLVCPKPAVEIRLRSQAKSFTDHSNRLRSSNKKVALPTPTGFDLNIATWNVEGLREISKCDQILTFSVSKNIHLLAAQETKSDSVNTFQKSGGEILHSGSSDTKHDGRGFLAPLVSALM